MLFGQETRSARDCSSYAPKTGSVLHGTNRAGDLGRLRVSSGGLPLPSSGSTQRQGVEIRLPWRLSFGFKPKTNAESLQTVNTFPHQHRPDKHHSAAPAPGQRHRHRPPTPLWGLRPPVPRVFPQPLDEPHGVAVPGHGGGAPAAATTVPAPPLPLHKGARCSPACPPALR